MAETRQDEADTPSTPARPRRWRRGHVGLWMVLSNALIFLLLAYGALSLTGQPVTLPGWVAARIEHRLDTAIAPASVDIARVDVMIGRDGLPQARLRDLTLRDAGGAEVARLNDLSARLSPAALASRRLAPSDVTLSGAQITVRRAADGRFAVSFGGTGGGTGPSTVSDVLARIEGAFSGAALGGITQISGADITLALEDARSGRIWQASNAALDLRRSDGGLTLTVISDVFNGTEDLARVQMSFRAEQGGGASIGAQVEGMPAADIALQSPALSFLGLVAAPIDGSVRAVFDAEGELSQVAASLEIGAGALEPAEDTVFEVSGGRVYLSYDPATERISFSEISLASEALTLVGDGHAYLRDVVDGWPGRLVGQFRLQEATIASHGMWADALRFDGGAADVNLRLDPFRADIGQLVLTREVDGVRRGLNARGTLASAEDGWHAALDMSAAHLTPAEILAFWPITAIPNTRHWIEQNVQGGDLVDITGSVRHEPGLPPRGSVSYEFENAEVRFLKHFPPITGGQGRAVFEGKTYTMVLNSGTVAVPGAGSIDLAGSTFSVPDVTLDPAVAEIGLRTSGPLRAGLELLDNKPFEILRKSEFDASLVSADATAESTIRFELLKDVPKESVSFRTTGVLSDVRLSGLNGAPGALEADRLDLSVLPDRLEVSGQARMGTVPVTGRWVQPLTSGEANRSRIEATVPVTAETLAALGIRLGGIPISGATDAVLAVDLARHAPAEFRVTSDLAGAAFALPSVGWSKPAAAAGELEITGTLGPALSVDTLRLEAPGLSAEGRLALSQEGALEQAEFTRVRLGGWLDAPVTIRPGRAGGAVDVAVLGGRVDLRAKPETGGNGDGGAVSLALDELVLSDTLSLRPFTALMPAGRAPGRFDARVNGGTAVAGDIVPRADGTGFRVRSADGGGVLNDARILPGASGGSLLLSLVPDGGPGAFRGQLQLEDAVLRDAPTAARLLDSMSVVGLLDDLKGQGIHFDTIDARFRIGDGMLRIEQASAVGGSMGVSLDGVYDLERKVMDLQGVISPLYMVNGIGSIFTRRGEGLFGMTFRMAGPAAAPSVSVNPLSMLTPGMFRDIFRRPPPGATVTQ